MKDKAEDRATKIMFLAVLTQSIIDGLDEEMGEFKFNLKRNAKRFFDEALKVMDKDFQDGNAVDQLISLSIWIKDVYYIMIEIGERSRLDQECFQQDWEALLTKHKLTEPK